MPYVPRPPAPAVCAHCHAAFASRHRHRKYCCTSCNVLAAQARKKAGPAALLDPDLDHADPASYAVPARFAAAVGPVEPVGSYFHLVPDDGPLRFAHRFRGGHDVKWLNGWGEYFPRADFALDDAGTVWLESYGHAERRWFIASDIQGLPGD